MQHGPVCRCGICHTDRRLSKNGVPGRGCPLLSCGNPHSACTASLVRRLPVMDQSRSLSCDWRLEQQCRAAPVTTVDGATCSCIQRRLPLAGMHLSVRVASTFRTNGTRTKMTMRVSRGTIRAPFPPTKSPGIATGASFTSG
jgi:hypothetical protein